MYNIYLLYMIIKKNLFKYFSRNNLFIILMNSIEKINIFKER